MAIPPSANRIELESQILCAALRQSWADADAVGIVLACQQLAQLFPDLVPPDMRDQTGMPDNYYELLKLDYDAATARITAAHLKAMKQFLRECPHPRKRRLEYYTLLTSGFILRKPRLRLSHDLVVARGLLVAQQLIPEDGSFLLMGQQVNQHPEPEVQPLAPPVVVSGASPLATTSMQAPGDPPLLVVLLRTAQLIEPVEEQALKNQSQRFPGISIVDLVMRAGYVSSEDMKALLWAESLIMTGQLPFDRFPEFFQRREELMRT